MTKFDALCEIIGYLAIYTEERYRPLNPTSLYLYSELAVIASENDWDQERIRKEVEGRV